jgi:hypothetical protein
MCCLWREATNRSEIRNTGSRGSQLFAQRGFIIEEYVYLAMKRYTKKKN